MTGQDSEVESVKSIMAGEQYDNGVKVVPAYLRPPVIVTKENAAEAYANNPTLLDIVKAAQ